MEFAAGRKPAIRVGELPRPVAELLHCHPAIVWLGLETFYKIARKHPEIAVAEFQQLYFLIAKGTYHRDPARPNCVSVHSPLVDEALCTAALKAADRGCEVWVSTFHRTNEKQIIRRGGSWELVHPRP